MSSKKKTKWVPMDSNCAIRIVFTAEFDDLEAANDAFSAIESEIQGYGLLASSEFQKEVEIN